VLSIFTDLGMKQILLAQCYSLQNLKFTFRFYFPAKLGLFLPGLAENSWQEKVILVKKDSYNNFLQNIQHKNNFQLM
jgi:hypothetical protein